MNNQFSVINCISFHLLVICCIAEPPPPVYDAPSIREQISDVECGEGEPAHFEAVIIPSNDPNLQVTWFRNGQPLAHGSKYAISRDFGFCTLDIEYAYPEDQVRLISW